MGMDYIIILFTSVNLGCEALRTLRYYSLAG